MTISEVIASDLCSGCGACAGLSKGAVKMEISDQGFLRPNIVSAVAQEQDDFFDKYCPGVTASHTELLKSEVRSEGSSLWGDYLDYGLAWSSDSNVRESGASGGVLTGLAKFLLESGVVDGVLLSKESRINPYIVETVIETVPENIINYGGSRYAPSAPLSVIPTIDKFTGSLAVIGRPCDISALRAIMNERRDLNKKIKYLLSFFCAGTPSILGSERIANKLKFDPSEIKHISYRGNGWPGKTKLVNSQGVFGEMDYSEAWGSILNKHLQWRCKICADGVGEAADIVVADGWDCDERGYPLFNEKKGKSVYIARSVAGVKLLDEVFTKNILVQSQADIDMLKSIQPGQYRRRMTLLSRVLAAKIMFRKVPVYDLTSLFRWFRYGSAKVVLSGFLGTIRTIVKSRDLS